MRFFLLPLLLIAALQTFAADSVLKFPLTKADGTSTVYQFIVPTDLNDQGAILTHEESIQRQHNAGVAALAWAKRFYGAHDIYLRSVELQEGPVPGQPTYYLTKFDGQLAGIRQAFFAIVLSSGAVLEPVESPQAVTH